MFPWILGCAAAVTAVLLGLKILFLYKDLAEIGRQFHDRLWEDTNNVIYVSGNDRYLRAFAASINQELGILYDRRRKYENGDRELKEAVTNISHDLRTPLTAIYGYLELMEAKLGREQVSQISHGAGQCEDVLQDGSCMEQMTHYLALIHNRTDAMRELVEELFRYSIILSAHQEEGGSRKAADDTRVVLNRFLEDCLLSYYDIFRQNQIEPEVVITDEEVVRFLDTGALKRVFCNILDNAVKYSKPVSGRDGLHIGKAALSVELLSDGTITFRNSAQGLGWVSVERLFDRFYTVETGRSSTGLGLSIAKILTERMGGSIFAAYMDGMLEIVVKL